MARTKQTPRKKTGPKGVPRHHLAAKNDAEVSPNKTKGMNEGSSIEDRQKVEIASLSEEIRELDRFRAQDARQMGYLQLKLEKSQECQEQYRRMLDSVTNQRDAAWQRENELQWRNYELMHAIQDADEMSMQYRDMAYDLFFQLHPPPDNAEDESGLDYDSGAQSEEEEDPEEVEPVNDGGDTDPDA